MKRERGSRPSSQKLIVTKKRGPAQPRGAENVEIAHTFDDVLGTDASGVQRLLTVILSDLRGSRARRSAVSAVAAYEVEQITVANYGPVLRKAFRRREIEELVSEARKLVWPNLNRQPVRGGSARRFLREWASVGVRFQLTKFQSDDRFSWMGFYAGKDTGLKSPIICVNTIYHQTAMSAAFAHEMGHHVFSQVSGSRDSSVHLMSFTGFLDHLNDPSELAADILVSVGIFPRQYLTGPRALTTGGSRLSPMDGVRHIAARYGLNLEQGLPPESRLQYLAGVIHYTKLRQAIFEEYDL